MSDKDLIKRLYKNYIRRYFKKILLALFFSILIAGSTAAIAWLLDPAIKKIFVEKKITIFECINQILVHKKPWDSFNETDQKTFSPFIINRWLSMDEEFIEVVNYFQKYAIGTLEPREVYKWYSDFLQKGKRFNKYIKGKKDKKYDPELINMMCEYFQCSKAEVKENLSLISKEEVNQILEKYGFDPKKIKSICKRNF